MISTETVLALLAQDDGGGGGGAAIINIGILLLIPGAMYFLLIRPNRRRQREQQELQRKLGVGSEVITNSGIYGTITGEYDDNTFWLEIDDDVQVKIARAAIQTALTDADETDDDTDDADETDDDGADEAAAEAENSSSDD